MSPLSAVSKDQHANWVAASYSNGIRDPHASARRAKINKQHFRICREVCPDFCVLRWRLSDIGAAFTNGNEARNSSVLDPFFAEFMFYINLCSSAQYSGRLAQSHCKARMALEGSALVASLQSWLQCLALIRRWLFICLLSLRHRWRESSACTLHDVEFSK